MSEMAAASARAVAPGKSVAPRVHGTVRIVGAGLLGSSIGHALRAKGVDVVLADASPSQLRLAIDYGAGRAAREDDAPRLIVVAVPPDVTADVIGPQPVAGAGCDQTVGGIADNRVIAREQGRGDRDQHQQAHQPAADC